MLAGRGGGGQHGRSASPNWSITTSPSSSTRTTRTDGWSRREDLAELAGWLARRGGRLIVDEAFMDLIGREAAWCRACPRPVPSCCALSARLMGWPGCASASPPDRARIARCCARRWDRGRCPARRSTSAAAPWRTKPGAPKPPPACARRPGGWTGCCARRGSTSLAARRCSGWGGEAGRGEVFERLCRAGILTRPFQAKPDWLRFGIPGAAAEWERLRMALHDLAAGHRPRPPARYQVP